jgi:translation initiation factor IF-1
MSREDLTKIAATVVDVLGGGIFSVQLANGQTIQARLSGRLRKYHIRVIRGDRITVGISPYDLSHGLILAREKLPDSRPPAQR